MSDREKPKRCLAPLWLMALGLPLLMAAAYLLLSPPWRSDAQARAQAALTAGGFSWASFRAEDGVGLITGTAPDLASAQAAAQAVAAALKGRIGFPGVFGGLRLEAPAPATPAAPAPSPPPPAPSEPIIGAAACEDQALRARAERGVQFASGSAQLTDADKAVLADIAAILSRCSGVRVKIEGHTDLIGAARPNQRLSEARAQAVLAELVRLGAAKEALSAAGYGETRPRAPGTSAAANAQNRRIDFVITDAP